VNFFNLNTLFLILFNELILKQKNLVEMILKMMKKQLMVVRTENLEIDK
jgi:hypothetical protein